MAQKGIRNVKKVYFAGSIRGGRDDAPLYFEIIKIIQGLGSEVLTEHIGLKDLSLMGEQDKTTEFIYGRDMAWLKECDMVVAEVTNPSLGVGYELAMAEIWKKPILCLYRPESGKSLSAMIAGNPKMKVAEYANLDEAQKVIVAFIAGLNFSHN